MNQSNPRPPAMPMRYSSRQKIFTNHPANQNQRNNPQEETYRLVAKIRSLQDDIRALLATNADIQADNTHLTRTMSELEYALQVQQAEIQNLTERIQAEQRSPETIEQYESTLAEVGEKVDMLNEIIWERNTRHEELKTQRDSAMQTQMQLKEHNNRLRYEHNRTLTEIDQLVQLAALEHSEHEEEQEERVERLIQQCKQWQNNLKGGEQLAETRRQQGEALILAQREKQIKIQYNIKLLKQRVKDNDQKNNYFSNCYNEESIQNVIDDMLTKEHQLRTQISQQAQTNTQLQNEGREALISAEKRIQRERDMLLEEIKLQQMENELQSRKKEVLNQELTKISQNSDDSVLLPSSELLEVDREPYPRIRRLETQNGQLASELTRVQSQVELLRRQLLL